MHGAVLRMVLVAAGYVELGPRLKRSNLEYVILQGSQFHRTKWRVLAAAAGRGPRAAVGRSAAVLCVRRLLPLREHNGRWRERTSAAMANAAASGVSSNRRSCSAHW